jgi:hypothetical protein
MGEFENALDPILKSISYKKVFCNLKSAGVASEYHNGDILRQIVMSDIIGHLKTEQIPEGPIFEYGPSTGVLRMGLPEEKEFIVKNWPEVDCMREDFPKESLAVIIADYTLEHISKPWLAVEATMNMLKPGGIAIYTTHWVFLDHTGDQEEDYWRFSPKGLKVLFDNFSKVTTGCWGNAKLTCEILKQYSEGSQGVLRKDVPEIEDSEIVSARDRIYAVSSWIVAVK